MHQDAPHPSRRFDAELEWLSVGFAAAAGRAEANLDSALEAMERADPGRDAAQFAAAGRIEAEIDRLEIRVTEVIALRQPVAADLRTLLCMIKLATALRRTAQLTRALTPPACDRGGPDQLRGAAVRLGRAAQAQLAEALTAWQRRDPAAARAVQRRDDRVDRRFEIALLAAAEAMVENPAAVASCARWLMIARALERIADLAVDIAGAAARRDACAPGAVAMTG